MRLSTARDEIEPLRDPRVSGPDDPYLTILVIARVISDLGTLSRVTPNDVEGLFAADLAFLQDLYGIINFGNPGDVPALQRAVLPVEEAEAHDAGWAGEASGDESADSAVGGVTESTRPDPDTDNDETTAPTDSSAPRRHGRIEEVVSGAGR